MELTIGLVIVVCTCVLFWQCLPRGGQLAPLVATPLMEVTMSLVIICGLTLGGALVLQGVL